MILTLLALAYALWVFADCLGMCYVVLGAALLLAWAWWELRELPRPISQPIANKELSPVCFLLIDSVENPLFEQLLWWVLPRGICIKRFQHRVMLRDYTVVYSWPPVDYYTSAERLLRRALPDNFLVRHLLHWLFHDMPRGGVCPVDGIKTGAGTTLFGFCDYMSWFSSTKPYLYITTSNVLEMHDSDNARLGEEASCKADGASTLPGGTSGRASNPIGDTTTQHRHAPIASSTQPLLEQPDEPDVLSVAPIPEPDGNRSDKTISTATAPTPVFTAKKPNKQVPRGSVQKPANAKPEYSRYDRTSADGLKKTLASLDISPGYYRPRLYCHDCFVYREEIKEAAKKMNLARKNYLVQDAQRNTGYGISWRRAICAFIEAKGAWYDLGLRAKEHATKQCKGRPENRVQLIHSREICPKRDCDTQERTPPKDSAQSTASTSSSASIGLSPAGRDATVGDIAQATAQQQGPSTFDMGTAVPTQNIIKDNGAASDRMLNCQFGPSWQPRGWLPGDKPPVARAQTAATLEVTTTTPAPSLVAAASMAAPSEGSATLDTTTTTPAPSQDAVMPTASTVAPFQDAVTPEVTTTTSAPSPVAATPETTTTATPSQTAAPPATLTMPASSQAATPQAVLTPPGPSQAATSIADTTTTALTHTTAPQLAQRTIAMEVDAPAQNVVAELYPVGHGAIGGAIAHTVQQQQLPDTSDMDIEAPGQDIIVDNGPVVFDGIHAPAPQPVNNTFEMEMDDPAPRAVAGVCPAGQGATGGAIAHAPAQQQFHSTVGTSAIGRGVGLAVTQAAAAVPPIDNPAASTQTALVPTAFVPPAAPVPSGIAQTTFSPAAAMPANPAQTAFGLAALAQAAAMSAAQAPTGLAQTTIATPAHNPPTTFVGQTGSTQFTSMPAVPTGPAPTGFAPTGFAPTGFAPTTTATASTTLNAPTQVGMTLPPPTSTGPAPPATTFTFTSTSGPSRTQPQTNVSALRGSGSRGRQSGRLGNRIGKGGTNQKAKPAEPREDANVSGLSVDKSKYTEEHEILEEYYPKILKRREDIGTTVATPHMLAIDRMYVVLLYIAVKERTSTKDGAILKMQLYALFGLSDRAIYDKYQKLVRKDPSKAIEGVDESAFE